MHKVRIDTLPNGIRFILFCTFSLIDTWARPRWKQKRTQDVLCFLHKMLETFSCAPSGNTMLLTICFPLSVGYLVRHQMLHPLTTRQPIPVTTSAISLRFLYIGWNKPKRNKTVEVMKNREDSGDSQQLIFYPRSPAKCFSFSARGTWVPDSCCSLGDESICLLMDARSPAFQPTIDCVP